MEVRGLGSRAPASSFSLFSCPIRIKAASNQFTLYKVGKHLRYKTLNSLMPLDIKRHDKIKDG